MTGRGTVAFNIVVPDPARSQPAAEFGQFHILRPQPI
jgi:hypothetical protein